MGADAVASRVTEAMKDAHEKSSTVGATILHASTAVPLVSCTWPYPVSHQR
jgi:hypothetical protein